MGLVHNTHIKVIYSLRNIFLTLSLLYPHTIIRVLCHGGGDKLTKPLGLTVPLPTPSAPT